MDHLNFETTTLIFNQKKWIFSIFFEIIFFGPDSLIANVCIMLALSTGFIGDIKVDLTSNPCERWHNLLTWNDDDLLNNFPIFSDFVNLRLLAMDVSALVSMKDAACCETQCDVQNSEIH